MADAYQIKNQEAIYYVTFQVVGRADVFTRKVCRDIVVDSFAYCRKEKGLELFSFVIMSNHVHAIIRSKQSNLSGLVRDFKKHTSKELLKFITSSGRESRKEWLEMIFNYHAKFNKRTTEKQLWTHENHAVEMDTADKLKSRIDYIHQNPVRSAWVEKPEEYLYSSARNFAGLDGVITVDEI